MAHYRARRYREAIHEFELSIATIPSADVWFNIGRAHEQLGEFRLAVESYRRYLRDRVNAPDAAELTAHIQDLTRNAEAAATSLQRKANLGALAIDADQPGALVLLDGRRLGLSPVDRILEVSPGPHRLEVSRLGYIPFHARIEVQPGALSAAYVDLQPLTRLPPTSGGSVWTWVVLGASGAALITSAAFGVLALNARQQGERDNAQRWARASDFSLGGALVLGLGAAISHFAHAGGSEVAGRSASR
jgi:tetratricopeptide (TPR) repeat protein